MMANLPPYRLAPFTPPFFYTAIDLFGPIKVKVGRNKTDKYWGVLFTCLNVRAVYIDVATDYSTPGILPVLTRFFCILGYPRCLWSDRGSQLVGAEAELRKAIEGRDTTELKDFLHEKGMEWKFVTPTAAHHNGCAESLIRVTKAALKKSIGDQVLAPLECQTVLFEAANLLNQRPIGRIPNDPADGTYLCPNDILLGRASTNTPQSPFRETKNPRHRYEFCQRIVDNFWKRIRINNA
jgi:hypothetical protein